MQGMAPGEEGHEGRHEGGYCDKARAVLDCYGYANPILEGER